MDPDKLLSREEVRKLINTAEKRAKAAIIRGSKVPVRDYFIIDLALSTGLRVMEIAQLNCGDVFMVDTFASLLVRNGKGGKRRLVSFNGSLGKHFREYMAWKRKTGEPIGPQDPLFLSSNTGTHMTIRAIQKVLKRTATRAGLSSRYSIHCLRHTYAYHLHEASGHNLRLVQKQLGHADIRTTEIYLGVTRPELQRALEKLYR
jgi:site-specific recombinase XerD